MSQLAPMLHTLQAKEGSCIGSSSTGVELEGALRFSFEKARKQIESPA